MSEIYNMDFKDFRSTVSCDAIIMDPPYGITREDYDKEPVNINDIYAFAGIFLREGGRMVTFCDIRLAARFLDKLPKGWTAYDLVWHKTTPTGFLNARRMPLRGHEMILVITKPGDNKVYNPQMSHGHMRKVSSKASKDKCKDTSVYGRYENTGYDSTDRFPTSVLTFKSDKQQRNGKLHPAQKPVDLLRWLVRTYTNEGDTVIDPFAGSGTTGVACQLENRRFVLIEKNENYFNILKNRIYENSGILPQERP